MKGKEKKKGKRVWKKEQTKGIKNEKWEDLKEGKRKEYTRNREGGMKFKLNNRKRKISGREGRQDSLQPRPALGQILETKLDYIRLETLMIILLFFEYTLV